MLTTGGDTIGFFCVVTAAAFLALDSTCCYLLLQVCVTSSATQVLQVQSFFQHLLGQDFLTTEKFRVEMKY